MAKPDALAESPTSIKDLSVVGDRMEVTNCHYRINKRAGDYTLADRAKPIGEFYVKYIAKLVRLARKGSWHNFDSEIRNVVWYSTDAWNAMYARLPFALAESEIPVSTFAKAQEAYEFSLDRCYQISPDEKLKALEIWSIAKECLERRNQGYVEYGYEEWDCKVRYWKWCKALLVCRGGENCFFHDVSGFDARCFDGMLNPIPAIEKLKLTHFSRQIEGQIGESDDDELPIVRCPSFVTYPRKEEFGKLPIECKIVKLLWEHVSEISSVNAENEIFPRDLMPGCKVFSSPCSKVIKRVSYHYNSCVVEIEYGIGFVVWYHNVPAGVVESWAAMADPEKADSYLFENVLSQCEPWYHLERVGYWPDTHDVDNTNGLCLADCLPESSLDYCRSLLQKVGAQVEVHSDTKELAYDWYDLFRLVDSDGMVICILRQGNRFDFLDRLLKVIAMLVMPVPMIPEVTLKKELRILKTIDFPDKWWKLTYTNFLCDVWDGLSITAQQRVLDKIASPVWDDSPTLLVRNPPLHCLDEAVHPSSGGVDSVGAELSDAQEPHSVEKIIPTSEKNMSSEGQRRPNCTFGVIGKRGPNIDGETVRRQMMYEHLAHLDALKEENGDSPSPLNGRRIDLESPCEPESDDLEAWEPDGGSVLPSERLFGR